MDYLRVVKGFLGKTRERILTIDGICASLLFGMCFDVSCNCIECTSANGMPRLGIKFREIKVVIGLFSKDLIAQHWNLGLTLKKLS